MTFSLAARCRETGMFGAIIASSSVCVGARCAFADSRGAALSQNVTDPALGPRLLAAAEAGAQTAVERVAANAPFSEWRQLALVDRGGGAAFFNGAKTLGVHAAEAGDGCVALGNLLASGDIPAAMVGAFAGASGHLAERLLAALEAGENAGGERGEIRSAGMLAHAEGDEWPAVNLRVDWSENPPADLRRLWETYRPQMDDYILRARDPDSAPPFDA